MLGAALGRAEGDDLGVGRAVERQPRAGDDPQPVGAGIGEDVARPRPRAARHGVPARRPPRRTPPATRRRAWPAARPPRPPRQRARIAVRNGPLNGSRQVVRRVGGGDARRQVEPRRPLDPDGAAPAAAGWLTQMEDRGAARRQDQPGAPAAPRAAPASPRRRARPPARRGRRRRRSPGRSARAAARRRRARRRASRRRASRAHRSNVAICGTWSDGLPHSRASSTTSNPVAARPTAGDAQIWSSRRPRSFTVWSALR